MIFAERVRFLCQEGQVSGGGKQEGDSESKSPGNPFETHLPLRPGPRFIIQPGA